MRAFIVSETDTDRFEATEQPRPKATGHDIVVKVAAVSVNPVDMKVRPGRAGQILGWDASGTVVEVGDAVERFAPGDAVYYAGDITRPGTNAAFHAVDSRIVGRKPERLSHVEAAALPLTALTAWEGLYEQLRARRGGSLLIINSAGGVGSIVAQLARKVSGMTVIGTASRPESAAWSKTMGVQHIINHREPMPAQLAALGLKGVDFIFCCYDTALHFDAMAEMINPQGHIVSIVESSQPLPIGKLMTRRASFSWELMFTRSMFGTDDLAEQGAILDRVADLVDAGTLSTTLREDGGVLDADALAAAHARLAAGTVIGKIAYTMPD